ncbi:MAG: transposase [candidate division Zixibacteria bacterium]|nr:transposase [candidate division Zixibacteria bacterium]
MPRKARIDAPGALQHIIIRGIERRSIFKDAADRNDFLRRLGGLLSETQTGCYAWVLMSNHVHLLLTTGRVPLATLMRRLLTGYAVSFNRRHKRHGQLFQNRYKSFLCEQDVYLKELVRYIHLNPLRAKVVKDLNQLSSYRYSGHAVLLGKMNADWQDTDYVLGIFGASKGAARRAYVTFVVRGISQGRRPDLIGGGLLRSVGGWSTLKGISRGGVRIKGDERILGSSKFVERVLKEAHEDYEQRVRMRAVGPGLDELIARVAHHYGIAIDDLKTASKQRTITEARTVLCYLAVRRLMISCADVARTLNISPAAVSRAVGRGQMASEIKMIQKGLLDI